MIRGALKKSYPVQAGTTCAANTLRCEVLQSGETAKTDERCTKQSLLNELFLCQTEPALTSLIVEDRGQEVLLLEIGPESIGEIELGVR